MADVSRWVRLEATTKYNDPLYVCTACGDVQRERRESCSTRANGRPEAKPLGVAAEMQRLSCGAKLWVYPGLTRAGVKAAEDAKRRSC